MNEKEGRMGIQVGTSGTRSARHNTTHLSPSTPDFEAYVEDDPQDGMFTVDRNIFTDPVIFDLEMKYIFEGTWIYLAHESQLLRHHDFYTTTIGRQPIILMRNQLG